MDTASLHVEISPEEHRALRILVAIQGGTIDALVGRLIREELATAKDLPRLDPGNS